MKKRMAIGERFLEIVPVRRDGTAKFVVKDILSGEELFSSWSRDLLINELVKVINKECEK